MARRHIWSDESARHLLQRATFTAVPQDVDRAVSLGKEGSVNALLAGTFHSRGEKSSDALTNESSSEPLVDWAALESARQAAQEARRGSEQARVVAAQNLRRLQNHALRILQTWWMERMARDTDPLREKLTLFWHGHFATSYKDVRRSHLIWLQNNFLRQHALDDFRTLLSGISKDPAMILYLDNNTNRKGKPNENFARELFELFSMGIGNYSEKDIQEAARAFTGWHLRGESFYFNKNAHDDGVKQIFGQSGEFDGDDVVDIVMKQPETPQFMARKLLVYYLREDPTEAAVERWAQVLKARGFSVKAFLGELFASDDFYADDVIGTQIKSPVQLVAGSLRLLANPPWVSGLVGTEHAAVMGQILSLPPNVAGWDSGPAWISTSTIAVRHAFADLLTTIPDAKEFRQMRNRELRLIGGMRGVARDHAAKIARGQSDLQQLTSEWGERVRQTLLSPLADAPNGNAAVDRVAFNFLGSSAISADVRALMTETLRQKDAQGNLAFLNLVLKMPEYQLC